MGQKLGGGEIRFGMGGKKEGGLGRWQTQLKADKRKEGV